MPFSDPASKRRLALPALVLLPFSTTAAETEDPVNESLNPIVVTATMAPRTVGESLSSVTVIDEDDIERRKPQEFSDLLESQLGLSVTQNGSFGKSTSVFTRGTASDATILLIDGIRIRSATSGGAAWQYLPPQLIKRVEIVRGTRSSLYGADAVGGVIQAFTMPQNQGQRGWVEAGAGNLDTQQYGAGFTSVDDQTRVSLGVNRFRTDGAPVVEGGDDKGYDNNSGVASASHQFANGVRTGFSFLSAEGTTEYEGGEQDFRFQTAGFNVDVPVTDYWTTSLQFSDARDELDVYSSFPGEFNTQTRTSRMENWLYAGQHEFVVGAEYLVDRVDGSTDYEESRRSNAAYFGQALLNFGPMDVNLSVRRDDNEAYGTEETYGAAVGYQIDANHRVRASVGTSFKAPSFNDLYYPGFGNPDLDPEEGISYELGVEGRYSSWFWDVAVYQTNVDDLSLPSGNQADSVPEAELKGIELSAGWESNGWYAKAAASVGDFVDEETGRQLRRRAERTFRVDLDKEIGTWTLGTTFRAESERYDDPYDASAGGSVRKTIAGFGVWDLRASKEFARNWTATVTVDDVLDKEYATLADTPTVNYISAGRTAMLTVRYDIQ